MRGRARDLGRIGRPCLPGGHRLWCVSIAKSRGVGGAETEDRRVPTDEENEAFRRSFTGIRAESSHAMDDRADEVDVKDGIDVYQMEKYSDGQEAIASQASHVAGIA